MFLASGMDSKYSLLDLPVSEGKDMGERRLIYSFDKEEHARLLFNNLGEMQAKEGLLTDVVVRSTSKDHEEPFHSMLLAVCSPVIKESLTGEHFDRTAGVLSLKDCTAEVLKAFRDFLYQAEFPQDEGLLYPLKAFAERYGIDSLQKMCQEEGHKDQHRVHCNDVVAQLYGMFQKSELTTTLLEDGQGNTQFAVHGALIAAASPVLREILSNDLFSQERANYRLKEVSSSILGDLIEYIYTGDITLEEENVVGLLNAVCRYELPALARPCCDWLSQQLDSHNAVGILWLARKHDRKYTKDLEEEAKAFIIANFTTVYEEDEFDELEYEDLKDIIQHDDLCVESEGDVFDAVAKWVEADEDGRSSYMEVLLQCVRLELTSLKFLDYLQEHPLIVKSARCLQIVQNAQGKLSQATDRGSFDSLPHALRQTDDIPKFAPQQYDSEEDIKRKLLEEFLQTEQRNPELKNISPRRGQRKNGKPDLRFKENRRSLGLQKKDGSPDMRFKINKEEFGNRPSQEKVNDQGGRPLKKDGTPDRRFKVNKKAVTQTSSQKSCKSTPRESTPCPGPLKKDGTPDMRFKVNMSPQAKISSSGSVPPPVKRDGTPDMRFKVNKTTQESPNVASPLKRDGTPDMRFSVNKQPSNPVASQKTSNSAPRSTYTAGPVKRDGTPDMRYAVNKQSPSPYSSYGGSSLSQLSSCSTPSGPLKRDGTPDMRYAVNKSSSGSLSSGYSSGGSSCSSRSSSRESVFGSGSCGPLKSDGTPDMRYAVNRSSYSSGGASYSSRSSSSGLGYGSSSCGPLKSNGTPDMRFKANRR